MSADVLAYGDDGDGRPPRGRSRALTAGLAVAVLVGGGVAYARTRDKPAPRRPAGWTDYPPMTADPLVHDPPADQTFADAVAVPRPGPHAVEPASLAGGAPGFVVAIDPNYQAYDAFGGPEHAPVLVGWCAPLRTFQDATATYVYDAGGASYDGGPGLPRHDVRDDPLSGNALEVAVGADRYFTRVQHRQKRPCPAPLAYPPLPGPASSVHATEGRYAVVHGRYVVTTETAAFCAAVRPTGCADQGWERFAPNTAITLPPGDLAGSYTWEGDFVVRASATDGSLTVVRKPETRLVREERVGVAVRVGIVHSTYRSGGLLHLRFNPMRGTNGSPPDDSPGGTPQESPRSDLMSDVRGGLRDYAVRADADIVIGQGITGLGLPKGTPETLRTFLARRAADAPLWLVLDDRGRVLRAVVDDPIMVM